METLTFAFILSLLFGAVQLYAFNHKPARHLAIQIKRYLLPELQRQGRPGTTFFISFRIDSDERLAEVQVHTGDRALNYLIRQQLAGQKIQSLGFARQREHWIQIRLARTDETR
ncbi:hypothetical protein [Larkinella harenae]